MHMQVPLLSKFLFTNKCTECCTACNSVTRCMAPSTHTTCCHNTAKLI